MSNDPDLQLVADSRYKYSVAGGIGLAFITSTLAGFIVWSSKSVNAESIAAIFAMESGIVFSVLFFIVRLPTKKSVESWWEHPLVVTTITFFVQVIAGVLVLIVAKLLGIAP